MILKATVKVEIEIPDGVQLVTGATSGEAYAFKLADGRTVEPAFCVRVESSDELSERFAVTDEDMKSVGVELLNYSELTISDS